MHIAIIAVCLIVMTIIFTIDVINVIAHFIYLLLFLEMESHTTGFELESINMAVKRVCSNCR